MPVVEAFTSRKVEATKGDSSDDTQRNRHQADRDPDDDVTGHVIHVTPHAAWQNYNTNYCFSFRDSYGVFEGVRPFWISSRPTRRLPGSGRVLHYPAVALPGPGRVLLYYMAGSGEFATIFATLNYTSCSERKVGKKWAFVLRPSLTHDTVAIIAHLELNGERAGGNLQARWHEMKWRGLDLSPTKWNETESNFAL